MSGSHEPRFPHLVRDVEGKEPDRRRSRGGLLGNGFLPAVAELLSLDTKAAAVNRRPAGQPDGSGNCQRLLQPAGRSRRRIGGDFEYLLSTVASLRHPGPPARGG